MAESPHHPNDEATMAKSSAHRSLLRWAIPMAGLTAVAVCAVASIILIRLYMTSRPLNIGPANAAMSRHIEDLLTMCQLPESGILRHAPITRSDEGARWNFYAFDIGVPATMSAHNVINTLKQGMALENVAIAEMKAAPEPGTELRFSMLDREFAVVRILGGAERYDLRAACDALAANVYDLLTGAPKVVDVTKTSVEDQEDGPTKWRSYGFRLTGAPGINAEALRQRVSTSLADIRDEVPQVSLRQGQRILEVSWRSRPIVNVDIESAPPIFTLSQKDFLKEPGLIYEESPLFFRGLYGFDPGSSKFSQEFSVSYPGKAASAVEDTHEPAGPPRAAIIVDDGGYGGLVSDAILTMDPRLTLSILPRTPFGTETAQLALARGFEILVHIPLESGNGRNSYPGELTITMDAAEMEARLMVALEEVPGAVGMNNHTGSKFTANEAAMKRLLRALKKHGLFFVDSRTTAETVAETVARELEVPFASRSVFLDNKTEPEYIRGQIAALVEEARTGGHAIGICHFRSTTAALLPEMVSLLESQGVSLVHVSELVR